MSVLLHKLELFLLSRSASYNIYVQSKLRMCFNVHTIYVQSKLRMCFNVHTIYIQSKLRMCFNVRKLQRKGVFATNSSSLIPLSPQPAGVNLWYFKQIIASIIIHTLKYLRSMTLGCNYTGIRKSETQFL